MLNSRLNVLFLKMFIVLLYLLHVSVVPLSSYKINLQDEKVFEMASDDANYDEETENEIVQPADLAALGFLEEDESRYKPLHSYVERYNHNANEDKIQFSNMFDNSQSNVWESRNTEEAGEPFIAGFKDQLDKEIRNRTFHRESVRIKRNDNEYPQQTTLDTDFFKMGKLDNLSLWEENEDTTDNITDNDDFGEYEEEALISHTQEFITTTEKRMYEYNEYNESFDEETYDYEKFKMEYEQQIVRDISSNKTLNYTEKEVLKEESPKEALKEFLDVKSINCTEAPKKLNVKTIDCFLYKYSYQYEKSRPAVKKTLSQIWLVIKVWFLIYISLAIPCWCQRGNCCVTINAYRSFLVMILLPVGWCCCCFRCKFCFPRKRILLAKKYYALNPPGTLMKKVKGKEESINYEPTEFEQDAYEKFETAIRNI